MSLVRKGQINRSCINNPTLESEVRWKKGEVNEKSLQLDFDDLKVPTLFLVQLNFCDRVNQKLDFIYLKTKNITKCEVSDHVAVVTKI